MAKSTSPQESDHLSQKEIPNWILKAYMHIWDVVLTL